MLPMSIGARLRYTLDHDSQLCRDLYRQRAAVERINSQAVALGVPSLYGFSQHVIPKPNDWDELQHITGYWFLDAPAGWAARLRHQSPHRRETGGGD
jgi:hypothetical protein